MSDVVPAGSRAKARLLGISRSSLWYEKKQPTKDWALKVKIEEVLRAFPSYGYRRIALHLTKNKKMVQRVMRIFGIKAYRRRARRWKKPRKQPVSYPNLLMRIVPAYPHHVWVADFTHLAWLGRDIRIATVMDVFTRDIVGIAIGTRGGTALVTEALGNALLVYPRPMIFHSDNGPEYAAKSFRAFLERAGITISRSKPGCPWENGYQESFYGRFKAEFGDPERFHTLGELVAEIYLHIHRYNTLRIHSALRMAPRQFALAHASATL